MNEQVEAVARLWEAHLRAKFPARLRSAELDEMDMVMLDADIAGCVSTWLRSRGNLDDQRRSVLTLCVADLARVLPTLVGHHERMYYGRLHAMAVATLNMPQ
ncbi:hypothetical protein BDK92_6250 [Micromonospora pisi]|uniref:Uncharacterized protein n=1 Tax=Micromonospora pisi TaxID=589240 RepID=A0A495JTF0_9ACTN|nr:hypothetical protein [Micromonospora pisi]RKR91828.1 hypothetical protein BDK92_6250 [Micromonospora pisi]